MSNIAIDWAFKIQELPPTAKFILVALANRANHNHEAWPSWKTIELDTGYNRKTIHKGIIVLQKQGYLMKIGSTKGRVCIYRVVITEQEKLSTTSTKIGTTQSYPHSTTLGTRGSTKIGTRGSTTLGIQNHNKNPKRNPKGNAVLLDTKTLVQNRLEVAGQFPTEELVSQILFYLNTKPSGDSPEKWINIAISVVKKKQWKIPEGWEGVTSASIAKKEAEYFRQKDIQQIEDDKTALKLKKEILERGIITNFELIPKRRPAEAHQPSQEFLNARKAMRSSLGL